MAVLQFPISEYGNAVITKETPFGPEKSTGFSDHLILDFQNTTIKIVAPFDGWARIVSRTGQNATPAVTEYDLVIQALVRTTTLALMDGLENQVPVIIFLNVPFDKTTAAQWFIDQCTGLVSTPGIPGGSTDPKNLWSRFLKGDFGLCIERGTQIFLTSIARIQVKTVEGVAVDPVAYFSYYLAKNRDILEDANGIEQFVSKLTRRALVQLVDVQGSPRTGYITAVDPLQVEKQVDISKTHGTCVCAEFGPGGACTQIISSLKIPDPDLKNGEQDADFRTAVSEWPRGSTNPKKNIIEIAKPGYPLFRRFIVIHPMDWFSSQYVSVPERLPRYTGGNRAEALIDGTTTFLRMYDDISAIPPDGKSRFYYLAGWSLTRDLKLVAGKDESDFQTLMVGLKDKGVAVRILLWDQLSQADITSEFSIVLTSVLFGLTVAGTTIAVLVIKPVTALVFSSMGALTAGIPVILNKNVLNGLADTFEPNEKSVNELNIAANKQIAILDGRVRETKSGFVDQLYKKIGSHHQKISVISGPSSTIAYCGGVDINSNRMDDHGHFITEPYHDVHCRIEGPAATDIVQTIRQRWNDLDPGNPVNDGDPVIPAMPAEDATQIIQVARTYPNGLDTNGIAYTFAPKGDFTIKSTLLKAIGQAKQFIYFEDQYLTPDKEIEDALIGRLTDPGSQVRIIIVIPRAADQPENSKRRADFIGGLLKTVKDKNLNPDRVIVLYPTKRIFPHDPVKHGPVQTTLREQIAANDMSITKISVESVQGFAEKDGYLLIDDEEFRYAESKDDSGNNHFTLDGGVGAARRGFNNTKPAGHKKGAFVNQVTFRDIYVHAKCWIIDDVFVSIGSANQNRRGMTHDSECNVFIIDGKTARGGRKFAKDFRISLWAEHLGLHGSKAARLLLDNPADSIDLLISTPGPSGNRLRRYWAAFKEEFKTDSWGSLLTFGTYWNAYINIAGDKEVFWNQVIDPEGQTPPGGV